MIITLIDATPNRLRYHLTGTAAEELLIALPSDNGATPDLRGDARRAAVIGAARGEGGAPLLNLLELPVANQAEARRVLMGERTYHANPHLAAIARARVKLVPVWITEQHPNDYTFAEWAVDANEGNAAGQAPSAGFSVLQISHGAAAHTMEAYLDIHLTHTDLDSQ